jgi:hypothetical protein
MGHVVTDKADDYSVPEDGGGFRNCVEQLAGEMGLAFLAEFAEARANGGGFDGL